GRERQPLLAGRRLRAADRGARRRSRDPARAGPLGLGLPRSPESRGCRRAEAGGARYPRPPPLQPGSLRDMSVEQRPTTASELSSAVMNRLIESRLTPNTISIAGLIGNIAAAVLGWLGFFTLGGVAFIIGSVMDTLDGRYARASGKGTLFGAFLDSTLDRVEEGLVLAAVGYYFAERGEGVQAA